MEKIELIVPCYNEEKCIKLFYEEVERVFREEEMLHSYEFMITYIDDGSRDRTLERIKELENECAPGRIRYVSFSRNFGKEAAIYAGMSHAEGDYVVLMDADLQHPPALIPSMLEAVVGEGYDCATARRISRKGEPIIRSALSKGFYHVFNKITSINLAPGSTDFRLMKKCVAKSIASLPERERFTKGIYSWIGFKNKYIEYTNVERVAGQTKWSMRGLLKYSYNGFMAFATTPLRSVIWLGILIVLADVVWIIKILYEYFRYGSAIGGGMTTLMLIVLFLGGVIITILGMIGEYLARIYLEVKQRPIYLINETNIK